MSSRESLWWDFLADADRRVVHRRDELPRTADVVVVGGGMLGVAFAWFAQHAGLGRVTLVEAQCLGAGASGGAAGLLTPEAHNGTDPTCFVELGRRSLKLWRELDQLIPDGVGLAEIDCLSLEPHPPGWVAPVNAEQLAAGQVADLVPGLTSPSPGVLLRHQAWLNPLRALAVLASDIDTVVTGSLVTEVVERVGGVEITTSTGRVSSGSVVFATGGPPAVSGLSLNIPSRRVRGHILVTAPTQQAMPGTVVPLATRLPDGRLLVGGTVDVDDTDEVDPQIAAVLRAWLDGMIPGARQAATTHTWCCFRPAHLDDLPVVDRVPARDRIWFTSGHYRTGILMAPATADALAEWIRTGERPHQVAEIGASRFGVL